MPHEVIMPALGMAQDSGVIVSWLKSEGEAVKTGEALMEVETDKATMEVEAAFDGFLTGIRAAAGQSVPVGDVVALISETADAPPPAPKDTPEEEAAAPAPPKGKTVIMPALGMAQDTGTIVAWLKAPGDRVRADEPLLEVETDKATMEVEAGHDGWLAELRGKDGEAVPVGEVIAIVTAEEPASPRHLSVGEGAPASGGAAVRSSGAEVEARDETPRGEEPAAQGRPSPSAPRDGTVSPMPEGRLLASPKAKRLARDRGLDLSLLVKAGHPQPYHVADLDELQRLAEARPTPVADGGARYRLTARVPSSGLADFETWMTDSLGSAPDRPVVLAAFAAASLRLATGEAGALLIRHERPLAASGLLADPDLSPLGEIAAADDGAPALILRDLTASRIETASLGDAVPVLTVTREGEGLVAALDAPASTLDGDAALLCLDDFAGRLADPLRHLL
ncbi:biotin/lipoyl-containing protein [Tranquillimonas alkanivorans]|uniref:Pyruvate dehydrogenase E2 component (Dihydrolipoamide acetyltransferase) n=1 Tax=Tranquillimonas alkanivorans TaxID=441119 RepID=A0A1I5WN90_9RHOB|nr:biotin/lipoyl-containing protein [Tranquillimonas alkanivorans]SFQ21150.1 pyruvate dehydrogenase E2 component (dihydrolipoamide acetyltransferase) [Tranquillimonas alkanivorans]